MRMGKTRQETQGRTHPGSRSANAPVPHRLSARCLAIKSRSAWVGGTPCLTCASGVPSAHPPLLACRWGVRWVARWGVRRVVGIGSAWRAAVVVGESMASNPAYLASPLVRALRSLAVQPAGGASARQQHRRPRTAALANNGELPARTRHPRTIPTRVVGIGDGWPLTMMVGQ